jgi:hypothetical protein
MELIGVWVKAGVEHGLRWAARAQFLPSPDSAGYQLQDYLCSSRIF